MIYRNRYILRLTIFLTALLAGGSITVMAQGSSTGVVIHGSVFGGGNNAGVLINSEVNMSTGKVEGNVYGGGNIGDVGTHAPQSSPSVGNYDWTANTGLSQVTITGGTIGLGSSETSEITKEHGNVFGGGKGAATTFECEQGMVYQTSVSINTTGSVVKGNVYGGGEVSRVEGNTEVTIGIASGSDVPTIKGSVFGAGAGLETHGYSALVRGTSTVTVQGKAQVNKNVYGGGELASVGRYKVKTPANASEVPESLPYGMPASLINGGTTTVTIQDNAEIGTESNGNGHVYGAGQGLEPRQDYDYVTDENYNGEGDYNIDDHKPKRMISGNTYEYFSGVSAYLQFVETLALSAATDVTIGGSATIWGSVFGGSESGFVYHDTDVKIQGGTVKGDAFGGGRGLESFAEAGRVRGNTKLAVSDGTVEGNVYGGGNMGDVGTIYKPTGSYDYEWKNTDANGNSLDAEAAHDNTLGNNTVTGTNKNTGICTVDISGGTIGLASTNEPSKHGNVFGAGQGSWHTWWCEKAIAYATDVSVSGSAVVYGNVYGGGEVGRVEDDAKVTIGTSEETGTDKPKIMGSVFGGGAGLQTHGYSALVRGDSKVTVQGASKVGGNVYGGGEVASVGRFKVVGGLPSKPKGGGTCTVVVKDNAVTGDVYGSCKGVTPNYVGSGTNKSKSMQLYANRGDGAEGTGWDYYESYPDNYAGPKFVWVYYTTKDAYLAFLPTLGLASNTHVTIGGTRDASTGVITPSGSPTINGSVFGGGQRGVTLGGVDVNIAGGTVSQDVYGGGALANSNSSHWHGGQRTEYVELDELYKGIPLKGYYTKSGDTYTLITEGTADGDQTKKYYAIFKTNVNLTGGTVKHNVYGGGLGQLEKDGVPAVLYTTADEEVIAGTKNVGDVKTPAQEALSDIEAKVYGDVLVTLNGTKTTSGEGESATISYNDNCVVQGSIFGCNNQNGSPQNSVTVHIYKTKGWDGHDVTEGKNDDDIDKGTGVYELAAVYGGGDLSAFYPDMQAIRDTVQTHVIIEGCDLTSIKTVYGGGNAAAAPATHVLVKSCYEIDKVFGGGNGEDEYITVNGVQKDNPGANVGYLNDGTTAYGTGKALAIIQGGTVHAAFGGSNTKGNIRVSANATLDEADPEGCPLCIDEVYGGGNEAYQDGTVNIDLGCISYLRELYGGSKNANIENDVVLNIVSGRFDRVFGGNNLGGTISGTITVNIEETGCHPIIIGQLYGGGNQAGYTAPSGQHGPTVNVKSFTSIGEIYGGGYGASADVTGDTYININEFVGDKANAEMKTESGHTDESLHTGETKTIRVSESATVEVEIPLHKSGQIGAIGNVYGGGNAADVDGSTHVNIGNLEYVDITTNIVVGTTDVRGYYMSGSIGYTEITGSTPVKAVANTIYYKKVVGVDIRGNVYGGGNAAEVTGDTNVVIGKETTTP